MPSDVEICNRALKMIGHSKIGTLNDITEAAQTCSTLLQGTIDEVLRAYNWNCATERASLAQLSETPAFGYAYYFALPEGCLRVLQMEDLSYKFKVEGKKLLTDEATAKILYIKRISVNDMDSMCQAALVTRLAWDLSLSLAKDKGMQDRIEKRFALRKAEAEQVDAQEGTPEEVVVPTWTDARL